MADLYGTSPPSSTPNDPEDISSFLHNLLHNPSSSTCDASSSKNMVSLPPETVPIGEDRYSLARSAMRTGVECGVKRGRGIDSCSEINFSDPGVYFPVDGKEGTDDVFSSVGVGDFDANVSPRQRGFSGENDLGDFSCDSEGTGASQVAMNPVLQRTSSKRTRAAEVHNLSEKRRRSRINEKMKALQNLIPNSNKTDKASMLDEAIEYLKQLQLQVQMLSMRNGVSLYPMCMPGVLQPMLLPQMGIRFDEGNELQNTNREAGAYPENQGTTMQTAYGLSNQSTPSNHQNITPSMTNTTNLETPFDFEQSIENHYGHFNLTTSSKEICRDDPLPQLQLDMGGSRKNSSSGVS